MSHFVRTIPTAVLAALTIAAAAATPATAATPTACALVDASHASALFARSVTAVDRPSPVSNGSSICMYMAGSRPFMQLAVTVMQTEGVAKANYAAQQKMAATHKNAGSRQKGNLVIAAVAMGGDPSKLNAILDLAVKGL